MRVAVYYPDKSGNAPSGAKAGDQIVTAGGTYEIVDGSKYQGMSSGDLMKAGIGYNPSTGLYSKKVSKITSKDAFLQNRNTVDAWLKQSNENITNKLNEDYNTNLSSLMQTFNTNKAGLKNQENQTRAEYDKAIQDSKDQSYYDAQETILGASRNGISNGMLAQAGANNAFYSGGKRTTDLARDRITALNNIYTNLNTLTQNYNISLSELEKNKLAKELSMLSDNQLAYLEQVMNIDTYNTDVLNSITQTRQQQEWQSAEAQKDRDEAQKDRDLQLRLARINNYYNTRKSQDEADEKELQKQAEMADLYAGQYNDKLTDEQKSELAYMIAMIPYGEYSYDAVKKQIASYLQNGSRTGGTSSSGSGATFIRNPYDFGKGGGYYNSGYNWDKISGLSDMDRRMKLLIK